MQQNTKKMLVLHYRIKKSKRNKQNNNPLLLERYQSILNEAPIQLRHNQIKITFYSLIYARRGNMRKTFFLSKITIFL